MAKAWAGQNQLANVLTLKLAFDNLDQLAAAIANVDFKWHLTWKRVRGAAKAGIVGAKSHFDHVQQSFADLLPSALTERGVKLY